LSAELGINPMTISKAYSLLEREAVIERRPGRPLVVRAQEADRAQEQKLDRLRESLAATVTMVRQLGIDPAEALRLFAEMLASPDDLAAAPAASGTEKSPPRSEGAGPSF
jgi:GntR family transcriptional regulator